MRSARSALLFFEQGACRVLQRVQRRTAARLLFSAVSRLGDGWIWLGLVTVLLLGGPAWRLASLRMLVTGLACTVLYACLKRTIRRPRPFHALEGLRCPVKPLDEFSFPSGHTMHAVAFTILAAATFPATVPWLVPFTALVGLSRVVLGLHYPSDVLAGAVIGASLAHVALAVSPLP